MRPVVPDAELRDIAVSRSVPPEMALGGGCRAPMGSTTAEIRRLEAWIVAIRDAAAGSDVPKIVRSMTAAALSGAPAHQHSVDLLSAYRASAAQSAGHAGDASGPGSSPARPVGTQEVDLRGLAAYDQARTWDGYWGEQFARDAERRESARRERHAAIASLRARDMRAARERAGASCP